MSELLKPCPFCGGEAKLSTYYDFYKVHCNSDDCLAGMSVGDAYNGVGKWYGSVAEAIDAWNTRAERTCRDDGGTDQNGQQVFNCSNCGCILSLFDSDGFTTIYTSHIYDYPRYCPNCGAKVVGA